MPMLGIALGFLVGLSLGLLGGGGSMLTVPILAYVVGYPPKQAIAMSLIVVGGTSVIGAVAHGRRHQVRLGAALLFGIVAMIGSYTSARVAQFIPGAVQMATFGIVMVIAAAFMFRGRRNLDAAQTSTRHDPRTLILIGAVGLGVGALTGLVGVGGGFLFVPAFVLLGGLPMKQAVGTSLVVIAMNCAAGVTGYLAHETIDWTYVGLFFAVAALGSIVGASLTARVSAGTLRRAFAVFLVLMGFAILYKNRAVFTAARAAIPSTERGGLA